MVEEKCSREKIEENGREPLGAFPSLFSLVFMLHSLIDGLLKYLKEGYHSSAQGFYSLDSKLYGFFIIIYVLV